MNEPQETAEDFGGNRAQGWWGRRSSPLDLAPSGGLSSSGKNAGWRVTDFFCPSLGWTTDHVKLSEPQFLLFRVKVLAPNFWG